MSAVMTPLQIAQVVATECEAAIERGDEIVFWKAVRDPTSGHVVAMAFRTQEYPPSFDERALWGRFTALDDV